MDKVIESTPNIIGEAAKSPLGLFALMIITLSILGFLFFRNSSERTRGAVFVLMFIGVVSFGIATFRTISDIVPTQTPKSPTLPNEIAKTAPAEVGTKAFQVVIPNDVESMWVHYQDRAIPSKDGCTRPPNADPISPNDVVARVGEFVEFASKNNRALIFTAYSPTRGWDAAAQEIRIGGKVLTAMTPYWCTGPRKYGYELNTK